MFCTKCGKEIPDGKQFCTSCGAPLQAEHGRDAQSDGRNDSPAPVVSLEGGNEAMGSSEVTGSVTPAYSVSDGSARSGKIEYTPDQMAKDVRRGKRIRLIAIIALAVLVIGAIAFTLWFRVYGDHAWSDEPENLYDIEALASMETSSLVEYLEGRGMAYMEDEYSSSDLSSLSLTSEDIRGWIAETAYFNEVFGLESLAGGEHDDLSSFVPSLEDAYPEELIVLLYAYGEDGNSSSLKSSDIQDGMHHSGFEIAGSYLLGSSVDAVELMKGFCSTCDLDAVDKVFVSTDSSATVQYVMLGTGKMYEEDAIWILTCSQYTNLIAYDMDFLMQTKDSFASITGSSTVEGYEIYLTQEGYNSYSL